MIAGMKIYINGTECFMEDAREWISFDYEHIPAVIKKLQELYDDRMVLNAERRDAKVE